MTMHLSPKVNYHQNCASRNNADAIFSRSEGRQCPQGGNPEGLGGPGMRLLYV